MEGNGMMTPMTPRDVCQTCCDSCPRSISFQDPWMARYCFRIVTWSFSEEKWSTNRRIWMDLGYVPLFFFRFIPTNDHIFYIYTHIHAIVGCFLLFFHEQKLMSKASFFLGRGLRTFAAALRRPRRWRQLRWGRDTWGFHLWWVIYGHNIWVNYNDLTATSLESWSIREIIPKWP